MDSTEFGISATSPTLSKIRRTKTTMDRIEKKNSMIRGSNTAVDDIGLHRPVSEGSWEEIMDTPDDAIHILEEPKRKKRKNRHQLQREENSAFITRENAEDPRYTNSQDRPPTQSPCDDLKNIVTTHQSGYKQSHSDSPLDVVMAKPLIDKSSITNGNGIHKVETVSTRKATRDDSTLLPSVVLSNGRSKKHLEKERDQDEDELARIGNVEEVGRSDKSNKHKKQKIQDSSQQERFDPWANDPNLPQENYKPRRSRFRGGDDGVDELIESIDFSKRPEVVAKARNKSKLSRRKTTGGAIVVHVDVEEEDSPFAEVEERPFEPVKSRSSKTPIRPLEKQEVTCELPEAESNLPKRKRGRPRKQNTHEPTSEVGTSTVEEQKHAKEQEEKRMKKERLSTLPEVDGNENETAEYNDDGQAGETEEFPEQRREPDFEPRDQSPSTPSPRKPTPQPLADKTNTNASLEPAPELSKPETETPKEEKVPTSHSPVSSSKIRYRVGLSRKARIEPLLNRIKK